MILSMFYQYLPFYWSITYNTNSDYSHNVTVCHNNAVKLGNYHRTRGTRDITTSVAEESDAVRWLCPEKVVDGMRPYSMAADVYRYGYIYQF